MYDSIQTENQQRNANVLLLEHTPSETGIG